GRQRQRRVDAEQRLVAITANRVQQGRVVKRRRARARRDVDDGRAAPVDPKRGESGLLALATAEVDAQDVLKLPLHAQVSVRYPFEPVKTAVACACFDLSLFRRILAVTTPGPALPAWTEVN